ncbi:phosphatase and actin regulator 2 [Trichonephila clavipes]|nr:phosphatase and actin regulator 2 [Trichonephila clavipes]
MYKNALKEDLIRVVEDLDGTVESTDTIVKLKTKIENSSTFESDPDFVKTLIKNCIDERVSQNEREVTSEQKIELAKLQLAKLEKEIELQLAKNKALSLNPAAKVEEKHLSVGTAISPTLTEEFIIHPSVYSEIENLGHAKSDVLLSESESSLGAHAYAYSSAISFPNVSVSNVIENSSYDLPYVKNFNTRNDSSSLIKDYKCNKIKITKLKLSIVREKCSDIVLCKKANGAMKTSSVEFISRSPNPLPMKSEHRRFVLLRKIFQPWQWKRRKKRNRFEQTSRTLQRRISMRSTKDQLVEKDILMPVKNNVFLWNLPDVEEVPSHDGETV